MSCLWVYSSNKVLRKRLCHCNVGPLQVLVAKASTPLLQFYFCDNEQDLLVGYIYTTFFPVFISVYNISAYGTHVFRHKFNHIYFR